MNIHTLDLDFQGFPQTIAAYLIVGPLGPVLVETGPASTLEMLKARLAEHGYAPADVRHVLVTHIHLDHAGAAGWWAQQGARVYVHHVGARHLIDPSRLLSSARRIYGDAMDTLWGETLPAPAAQVQALQDGDRVHAGGLTFTALETPGHARHHHVFVLDGVAFTGDAAGVRIRSSSFTTFTTPPPEFDLAAWQETLQRLLDRDPDTLYLTHFGPVEEARAHLQNHARLVRQAAEFVRDRLQEGVEGDALEKAFLAWNRERARAQGCSQEDWQRIEAVNPTLMSLGGLVRYWRKR